MSDNKEGEDLVPKGNDWEVVALTESTYAAAPGPKKDTFDQSLSHPVADTNADTADAMFMSGHFGYLPSMHENLPVEAGSKVKAGAIGGDHDVPEVIVYQGSKSELKDMDDIHIEGLIAEEFPGAPKFNESSGSFYSSAFGDIDSSNLIEKEQGMYSPEFGPYGDKATAGRSYITDEDGGIAEPFESLDHAMDPCLSNVPKHDEDDELSDFPCETWWKKHASYLCDHVKNVNPYWSIVVAAAVVGLVIIGHRWQRDKPEIMKLKSQLVIDDKGSEWILNPLARLKDVGLARQNSSYMRVFSSTEL